MGRLTLSMKNMFGVVPGTKYGWPKNLLHWKGIHRSILDICATVPIHFVIAMGLSGWKVTDLSTARTATSAKSFSQMIQLLRTSPARG